ncbi:response regulator transcription factor [Nonomuraea sp. NPDC050783]|uniref:response regulator n=1 Tax=Nonomuraea sp. NPDC050783 TaxID=3154634 RepID=UPI0034650FAA
MTGRVFLFRGTISASILGRADRGQGMIKVLVVDDQVLVRAGLAALLRSAGLQVVGEAADGEQAVRMAADLEPEVVLMDISMPRMDGITAMERILATAQGAPPKVLILTTFLAAVRGGSACGRRPR